MVIAVLGAPGSGKSTAARPLASLLPAYVVLDWDAFMMPAAALAGREITQHREAWPAYRQLVGTVLATIAHLPVVLLTVCTPDELPGWPIDAWVLLDCTDEERRQRLGRQANPDRLAEGLHDAREYRSLGLPVIDATGHAPAEVAADLARFVRSQEQGGLGNLARDFFRVSPSQARVEAPAFTRQVPRLWSREGRSSCGCLMLICEGSQPVKGRVADHVTGVTGCPPVSA